MIQGAFGSKNALADTIVKATPFLLVGVGICISFRGGVLNIGGEGQLIVGAICATYVGLALPELSFGVLVPIAMLAGFLGARSGAEFRVF